MNELGLVTGIGTGLFALALVIGMTVRAVRAERGQRMRAAFSPLMSSFEVHQELHTGQKGLQDSVIESIQVSEVRPSRTDEDPERD
ncbi:hypothetical protein [Agromyces sp. Leaf222]|uniref:hypothetical protein n=1 Tax=Agromyces sp. Leaf222 TaxID=1735688 RepID=UPI0006FB0D7F|nr:hypothetical protein [Agromyces sp. Leaf222]KQM80872.1 hypothetical protein ASE68_17755 [Agromyces sp. Leaf222]